MPQHMHVLIAAFTRRPRFLLWSVLPAIALGLWLPIGAALADPPAQAQPEGEAMPPAGQHAQKRTQHAAQSEAHADRNPNRLAHETSPYLLQHAYNPVNWYAWGEEAFEAARSQGKPIFLSIGYSTCYWCHVMERESFEDEATAAVMNEHFVSIKVDREERPDVDAIYMMATQLLTGHGGWPMSVFLEPVTLKPFLAGTYYPPEARHGLASFTQVLQAVAKAWDQQRPQIIEQANAVAEAVTKQLASESEAQLLGRAHVTTAVRQLMQSYDRQHGGFGGAPKFPQSVFLEFLLGAAWDDEAARSAVLHTLERMATGGMYDQLAGGFHRYSTDAQWIVPHFEKMLYDNGQLLSAYAEAFDRTRNPLFEKVVRETAEYLLREMQDEQGAFHSAQDAEVDAREGLSYLWTPAEVKQALTEAGRSEDIDFALEVFGLSRGTNFVDPHFPEDGPKNVLVLAHEDVEEIGERLAGVQRAMLNYRGKRKQPHTDDKILAEWNGLAIAGLADAGRVLGKQRWIDEAERAADFVLERMQHAELGLLRVSRGDRAKIAGFLEDYALMIHGLLALHRATSEENWLKRAATLAADAEERFLDSGGGYFETLSDQPDLFVRSKSFYDGAVPSGNGMMAVNLIELHKRTGRSAYLERAGDVLRGASHQLALGPSTCVLSALALHRLLALTGEVRSADVGERPNGNSVVNVEVKNVNATAKGTRFDIVLHIAAGYHINANRPGDERLISLAIEAFDASGAPAALHVNYPQGEQLDATSEFGQRIRVHHGDVIVSAEATSRIAKLAVRFQPCSDVACLAPQTVEIDID
jgi:uncharacterized protein YyaL (SSP411 family)